MILQHYDGGNEFAWIPDDWSDDWEIYRATLERRYYTSMLFMTAYMRRQEQLYWELTPEQELSVRLDTCFCSVEFALGPAEIAPYRDLRERLREVLLALARATGKRPAIHLQAMLPASATENRIDDRQDQAALSQGMQLVREDVHEAWWLLARSSEIAHWLRDVKLFAAIWTAYISVEKILEEMAEVDR